MKFECILLFLKILTSFNYYVNGGFPNDDEFWHNEKQVECKVDGEANENPDNCVAFSLKRSLINYEFNPNLGDRNCCRTGRFEC